MILVIFIVIKLFPIDVKVSTVYLRSIGIVRSNGNVSKYEVCIYRYMIIYKGKQVLWMSSEITTVWTAESPLLVTITYNAPGSGTLQVAAILSDFGLANINAGINVIFTPKVLTQTNMVVNITSTHPSNLIKLSISYIVFINR